MRKRTIAILSVMLSGLLICGIGAGIMFFEITSLDYIGEKICNMAEDKDTIEVSLEKIPTGPIYVNDFGRTDTKIEIKEDKAMADDILKIETIYDKATFEPHYEAEPIEASEKDSGGVLSCMYDIKFSEIESFFKIKDFILEDLKNNKIGSYRYSSKVKVTITASTKTVKRIVE